MTNPAEKPGLAPPNRMVDPIEMLARILDLLLLVVAPVLIPAAVLGFLAAPIAYDTMHLQDTFFFAELGWRVLNGFEPVIDFGHFYGGVIAHVVAWAFQLFGVTLKSIDYAFVMLLCPVLALTGLVAWRRLSTFSALALVLIVSACLLARIPMEELTAVQHGVFAHSFVYNRFACALAVALTIFALIPGQRAGIELSAALLCGVACYLMVLTKPTFVTFPLFFLIALGLTGRLRSLLAAVAGTVVTMALIDFGAVRVLGAFDYAVSAGGNHVSLLDLMMKAVGVFLVHPLEVLLVLGGAAVVIARRQPGTVPLVLAALALTAGYAGMTATMGWRGDIGQQTLPFLATLMIGLHETVRQDGRSGPVLGDGLKIPAALMAIAFAAPLLVHSIAGSIAATLRAPLVVPTGTPLDTYLAWSGDFRGAGGRVLDTPVPAEERTAAALAHLEAGLPLDVGVEYAMILDGIALLQKMPDIQERRIVGDYGVFAFLMQTRPVAGFPAWVSATAPQFAGSDDPLADADLVILHRTPLSAETGLVRDRMGTDFTLCETSAFWELHIRSGGTGICDRLGDRS